MALEANHTCFRKTANMKHRFENVAKMVFAAISWLMFSPVATDENKMGVHAKQHHFQNIFKSLEKEPHHWFPAQ